MSTDFAAIEQTVLKLDIKERAALAERLIASLDNLSELEHERLCADEAERRYKAMKDGRMETIPAEQVFADLRKRLSCR